MRNGFLNRRTHREFLRDHQLVIFFCCAIRSKWVMLYGYFMKGLRNMSEKQKTRRGFLRNLVNAVGFVSVGGGMLTAATLGSVGIDYYMDYKKVEDKFSALYPEIEYEPTAKEAELRTRIDENFMSLSVEEHQELSQLMQESMNRKLELAAERRQNLHDLIPEEDRQRHNDFIDFAINTGIITATTAAVVVSVDGNWLEGKDLGQVPDPA